MMSPDHYGLHRVLHPKGAFPQAAERLTPSLPIFDSEILIHVERLNLDSASFHQLWEEAHHQEERLKHKVLDVVKAKGKMHNPVTHSGGTLLGTVQEVGEKVRSKGFHVGDKIATLVSLTLTPLHLDSISHVDTSREQITVAGHAILFESGIAHHMPGDMPEAMALAIFDVCGAPALVNHMAKPGEIVVILGGGKAGVLSAAQARKRIGKSGKIILLEKDEVSQTACKGFPFIDEVASADLTNPIETLEVVKKMTQSHMADLVINCVNVPHTEMASILAAKHSGTVLFFNMATNFQAAVLGAEGVGHETRLIMGNGYTPGHADLALNLVRENNLLREWFEEKFLKAKN